VTGRTLVIDTATALCSAALVEGGEVVATEAEHVGRGHDARLLPMIAALPGGGRAERVLVDCGPGSFTGLRVGLAAARALGLGWDVPVHGYSSTAALAAAAFAQDPRLLRVAAALEGGHGELFMQLFDRALLPLSQLASLRPEAALAALDGAVAVGSGAPALAALGADARDALPAAADARLLSPELASLPPRPLYGRAPDAKPRG
jgi:tRNA threonylcarbamoyladenosine biosynthesis protein TsaB